jgi:hypothetical protein
LTFYNNFGRVLVLRVRNNPIKKERKMKNYIVLLFAVFATSVFADNTDKLETHFKNSEINFTDSDGDGMTDYAELKYGYDPHDNSSNSESDPVVRSFIVDDNLKSYDFNSGDDPKLLFSFSDVGFDDQLKTKSKNYLVKVLPLILNELGTPYKNNLCRIRRTTNTNVYSANSSGKSIKFGKKWIPSSIVHEILHCWRASVFLHTAGNMAWEEGMATAITSFITNEYLKCYPHDENSRALLSKHGTLGNSPYLFCSVDSLFDQSKFQRNLVDWKRAEDTWEYYQHSGAFFKLFRSVNESFTKEFHQKYFADIRNGTKRSHSMVVDIITQIVPTINGIDTKDFIESIPLFKKSSKLSDGFYAVLNRRGYINYTPIIYPAYAKTGKFDWYTFDKTFDQVATFTKPNGQIVPDLRNQPFQVDVSNVSGVSEFIYEGISSNSSNGDGSPDGNPSVKFPKLRPANFDQGLYSVDITFTNFTHSTETSSASYYLFGKKDLVNEIKSAFTIMIGVDSDALVNQYIGMCEVSINGKSYTEPLIKNCAYFNLPDVPFDYTGEIQISVMGPNVPLNFSGQVDQFVQRNYVRTLTNGGSTDGHRHYCFLVIDEDFDGVEDNYDSDVLNLQNEWDKLVEELVSGDNQTISETESTIASIDDENSQLDIATHQEDTTQTEVDVSMLEVETNNSVVVVSDVNDAFIDSSNNLVIETTENVVIVEDYISVKSFDGTLQTDEDDNVIIIESDVVALYANDSTTSELIISDSIVTISEAEIIVDANESDRNNRILGDKISPPPPPSVNNAWDVVEEIAPNWYFLEWFGYFYKLPNNNWIYHEIFGWVYVDFTATFDSVWIYHDVLGWQWTSQSVFSYTYNPYTDSWIYITDIGYYDFNLSKWIAFE